MRAHPRSPWAAVFCLCLLGAGGVVRAQPLDLLQAWQEAQRSDAAWLAAQAATRAGLEALPIARAALRPQVQLSLQRAHNGVDYADNPPQLRYFGGVQSLSVRQALYRPALSARVDQARAEQRDVQAREAAESAALLTRMGEAYFDLLLNHDQIELLQAQIASARQQLQAAGQARAGGSGTRTDEDEARARLDLLLAQALEARQATRSARQRLETLLQRPVDTLMGLPPAQLEQAPAEAAAQPGLFADPGLPQWLDRAERGNPELQALQAQRDATAHKVRAAKASHLPSLDLLLQWQRSDRDGAANPTARYRQAQASVEFNLPLYNGGGVQAAVRQALAAQEQAEHALEAARRDLQHRVTLQWRAMVEGQAHAQAYLQAVRSASQLVRATQASFSAGVRSNLDVLDAQAQLATARNSYTRARLQALLAQLQLLALTGERADAALQPLLAALSTPITMNDPAAMQP